ncbi:unnamed protein product [Vicia faba]|uniref:Reverse transcriptase zinc-binding domain-containing protein n=1 Tax=Vicia faba TaxID=3906 RepID=A0AAV0Z4J4_VICFA|nr:unnamed protein product [Vicia faba]
MGNILVQEDLKVSSFIVNNSWNFSTAAGTVPVLIQASTWTGLSGFGRKLSLIRSRSCLSSAAEETTWHLFFECQYAKILWKWLENALNISSSLSNWDDIWQVYKRNWSDQCKLIFNVSGIFSSFPGVLANPIQMD